MKRSSLAPRIVALAVMLVALFVLSGVAEACPTCKEAIGANDPQHQNMVRGYFYSILFMMSMPFLLIGSFSGYMYLEVRRARAAKQDQQQAEEDQRPTEAR